MPGDGGMRRFVADLPGDGKGIPGNAAATRTIVLEAAVEDGHVIGFWGNWSCQAPHMFFLTNEAK